MALINWSDSLATNIPTIDQQHKKLVEIVNNLHDSMTKGNAASALGVIFDELVTYTKTHFATEERLFDQHGYPNTAQHKKEHAELAAKAIALQAEFKSGKTTISVGTLNFLRDWLSNHITKSDKAYAPFLIQKGAK